MKKLTALLLLANSDVVNAKQDDSFPTPNNLKKPWYFQCHAKDSDCPIPAKDKNNLRYRIIMIGDSVSRGDAFYGFHDSNMIYDIGEMALKEKGWKFADKIEILNYSMGMRGIMSTGEKPFKKDPNWKNILESKPDAIVVMLGGNDSKCWNWKGEKLFEEDYVEFGNELLKAVEDKMDLYIMTPTPAYTDYTKNSPCKFQDKVLNEEIPKAFPPIMQRLKLDPEHNFVDAHKLLWGKSGDYMDLFHKEGYEVGDGRAYDRCHPNEAAHNIMARELYSRMKFRMNEVLDEKRPPAGYKYEDMVRGKKRASLAKVAAPEPTKPKPQVKGIAKALQQKTLL